ncbi:MAG: hypothetical protein NC408_05280 [Candidatus Gastranaerophilales bacterium]|nr:hypothetical protein [Candidatus Gastranaerophilales bacterium]
MAINAAQQVYSTDKKLWVGMNIKEAYKDDELIKLFNFADKNADGTLDEAEITRYNSPIIKSNHSDKTEYYAGLKLEEVKPEGQEVFRYIDNAPRDGVLSDKEMKAVADEIKEVKKDSKIAITATAAGMGAASLGVAACVVGAPVIPFVVGGALLFGGLGSLSSMLFESSMTKADIVKE